MGSIIENEERIGAFTSSEIYKLIPLGSVPMSAEELRKHKLANPSSRKKNKDAGFDKKGLTYIEEKKLETRLGRSISTDVYTQSMQWGKTLEKYVFSLINMSYVLTADETDPHPTIKGWAGSKDLIVPGKKVSDIKCYQPKKFAQYTEALMKEDVEYLKENFPQEYWQLVSNAIINKVPNAEAITFCPFESELKDLREFVANLDTDEEWKNRFIVESPDASLAFIKDNCYYQNLNIFEFVVPQADKDLLEERVFLALTERNKQLKVK